MTARLLRRLLHTVFPMNCRACDNVLDDDPIPFFVNAAGTRLRRSVRRVALAVHIPFLLRTRFVPDTCADPVESTHRPITGWTPYAYSIPIEGGYRFIEVPREDSIGTIARSTDSPNHSCPNERRCDFSQSRYTPIDSGKGNSIRLSC